jgi:outer membrane lipoprotein-sorting protein
VKLFRQISTRRLVTIAAVLVAAAVAAGVASVTALGRGGSTPPPKALDKALQAAVSAPAPAGVTARIRFTNSLLPSAALAGTPGAQGSALLSGASGRLWLRADGRGRLELQSDAGDTQVVWDDTRVSVFDSSSNTVYELPLASKTKTKPETGTDTKSKQPTLAEIDTFLGHLGNLVTVSGAKPTDVAGRPAYRVTLEPKHSGGLLGSLALAWDAEHGVPLEVSVYAQGATSPVLALRVTDISFGAVPASDVTVTPPAGAKTVDLGAQAPKSAQDANGKDKPVTGLDAVRAAVPFSVSAPDTLVGLPRQTVRLVGGGDSKSVLILYGHGLGGIAVLERAAAAGGAKQTSSLPKIALGSATGHELATPLGTVLFFDESGVSYVLAGSMPPAAAEAAARSLR